MYHNAYTAEIKVKCSPKEKNEWIQLSNIRYFMLQTV